MQNQGHVRNTLSRVMRDSIEKLKEYEESMMLFEKEPLILMSEVFHDKNPLLLNILYNDGEESLIESQEYWFQYLIPRLSSFLATNEFILKYNKNVFPALIHFTKDERSVATLDIYNHVFEKIEPEEIEEWNKKRKILVKKHNDLADELENLYLVKENPLVVGGANPIELMKISVNKDKYIRQTENDIETIEGKMQMIEETVKQEDEQIELLRYNRLLIEEEISKVLRRLSSINGYKYIGGNPEDVEQLYQEELDTSEINENKQLKTENVIAENSNSQPEEEYMFKLED